MFTGHGKIKYKIFRVNVARPFKVIEMKSIPSGKYSIGTKKIENSSDKEDMKQDAILVAYPEESDEVFHQVILENAFVIGTTEITQEFSKG